MFSVVSNAGRSSSSHASGGLDLLASVALTEYQIARPSNNTVVDCNCSSAEDTAISDFGVRLVEMPEAVLASVSVKDKTSETSETSESETSETSSTVDVNDSEKHEFTTAGMSGIKNNKDKGNICTETFKEKRSLAHIHGHDKRNKTYSCDKCTKTFLHLPRLKAHMLCHNDEKKFSCSRCHMKFKRKNGLSQHYMAIHDKKYTYQCDKCSHKFYTNSAFVHHKQGVHKEEIKCPCCDECFTGISFLQSHLLVDHGVIKVTKRYTESGRLTKEQTADDGSVAGQPSTSGVQGNKSRIRQNHREAKSGDAMRPITRSNPNYCPACSQAFRSKTKFTQHNIDHHGMQTGYICEYCSEHFAAPSYVQNHKVMKHPDKVEGRHNCDQCGRKFWNLSERNRHIDRIHSRHIGTDPFRCFYCHEEYTNAKSLKSHMLHRHNDQNISDNVCMYCKKQFSYPSLVRKHIKHSHSGK